MKNNKCKLYSVATLGVMMVSVGLVQVEAKETISAETKGEVTFKRDDETGPIIVDPTDPENPNVIDPEGGGGSAGNGTKSFNINWVSEFKFGDMLITGQKISQYADSATLNFIGANDTDEQIIPKTNLPNFIQVTDNRGTNTGWKVTASASEFRQYDAENQPLDDKSLKGAQLLLTNPQIFSQGSDEELSPTANANSIDLLENKGTPVSIMTAAEKKGQGTWSLAWSPNSKGEHFEFVYNEGVDKGVQLVVPVTALPEADKTYTSEIEWILSDTPTK